MQEQYRTPASFYEKASNPNRSVGVSLPVCPNAVGFVQHQRTHKSIKTSSPLANHPSFRKSTTTTPWFPSLDLCPGWKPVPVQISPSTARRSPSPIKLGLARVSSQALSHQSPAVLRQGLSRHK